MHHFRFKYLIVDYQIISKFFRRLLWWKKQLLFIKWVILLLIKYRGWIGCFLLIVMLIYFKGWIIILVLCIVDQKIIKFLLILRLLRVKENSKWLKLVLSSLLYHFSCRGILLSCLNTEINRKIMSNKLLKELKGR